MGIVLAPEVAVVSATMACANHPDRRARTRGLCASCYNMARRSGALPLVRSRDRMAECHPDRRHFAKGLCSTCYQRQNVEQWRATNPDAKARQQTYDYLRKYGLTAEQVALAVAEQGGRCAICGKVKRLVVDHHHATGRVRGMLCIRCNTFLGYLESEDLEAAIAYLEGR